MVDESLKGRGSGRYLATVLEGKPEGEVAAALGVLGVGEDDGALCRPVEPGANAANGGAEDDEPPKNSLVSRPVMELVREKSGALTPCHSGCSGTAPRCRQTSRVSRG